jgi:hypothetical protein
VSLVLYGVVVTGSYGLFATGNVDVLDGLNVNIQVLKIQLNG